MARKDGLSWKFSVKNYSKNAESNENQPSMSQKCGSISVKECVLEVALRLVTRCIYKV